MKTFSPKQTYLNINDPKTVKPKFCTFLLGKPNPIIIVSNNVISLMRACESVWEVESQFNSTTFLFLYKSQKSITTV
jgi:hypothetical protein